MSEQQQPKEEREGEGGERDRQLPIMYNREDGGRLLRYYWEERARTHPHPKESWLIPWPELGEWDKETDRYLWDHLVAPYVSTISELIEQNQRLRQEIAKVTEQRERLYKEGNTMDINGTLMGAHLVPIPVETLQAEALRARVEHARPGEYYAYQVYKAGGLFVRARNEALYHLTNGHLYLTFGIDTPMVTKTEVFLSAEEISLLTQEREENR